MDTRKSLQAYQRLYHNVIFECNGCSSDPSQDLGQPCKISLKQNQKQDILNSLAVSIMFVSTKSLKKINPPS